MAALEARRVSVQVRALQLLLPRWRELVALTVAGVPVLPPTPVRVRTTNGGVTVSHR